MMTDVERSVLSPVADNERDIDETTSSDRSLNASNDDAPPQSQRQDSIFIRLKSLTEDSDEPKDCLDKMFSIFCGSAVENVLIVVSSGILIAMITMGSIYLNECSAERFIPIYLIVGGCFGLLQNILSSLFKIIGVLESNDNSSPGPGNRLLYLFLFAWHIAGSVWVYRTCRHFTITDPTADNYCHPVVYWFAFGLISAGYVFVGFVIVIGIIALCYVQCSHRL